MIARRDKLARHWKSSVKQEESCDPALGDQTTFRHDFQTPDTKLCYRKSILPPEPARINISSSDSPVNAEMYRSAMKASYEKPSCCGVTNSQASTYDRQRIYNTNFKTGVDNNFNGFCTSNHLEYSQQRMTVPTSAAQNYANPLSVLKVSNPGPLGNKTLHQFKPEYLDSYREFPMKSHQQVLVKKNHNEDHMKGTYSSNVELYRTTTMDTFRGQSKAEENPLPLSADLQQRRITSIPLGDRDKFYETSSVFQQAYHEPSSNDGAQYNKQSAHTVTHQSSINFGDPMKINEMKSALLPLYGNIKKPQPVVYERNASSFPAGDLNNDRVKDRLSNSTCRMFSKPPPGSFSSHVDGSCLRTLSHIHLGNDKGEIPNHQTMMKKSYCPLSITGVEHVRAPLKDNIPFNYPNDLLSSTVKDSFGKKEITGHNRMTLENLKKSHWELPNMGIPTYYTTHQADFTLPSI